MGASGEERVSGTQSGLAGLLVCHAVPPCDLTRTKLTQEIRTKPSCQARRGAADMVHSRDRPDHHVRPEARHRQQPRLRVLLSVAGFRSDVVVWSVAAPYDGTPDEQ